MSQSSTSTNSRRGEVLVAIVNNVRDFEIARDRHWYRIPVSSQQRFLKDRWPPQWLALYQTKVFGSAAYSVRYYARVKGVREVTREQLFPKETDSKMAGKRYYQIKLAPIDELPAPIFSRRFRRIVFIPTTWRKLIEGVEINDLFDDSLLEDRLWAELKRLEIWAERQFFVKVGTRQYALDFAILCNGGKINVETDGDWWHINPERAALDNVRNNELGSLGWTVLRFNGQQIDGRLMDECLPQVLRTIEQCGGLQEEVVTQRVLYSDIAGGAQQLALFEDGPDYDLD